MRIRGALVRRPSRMGRGEVTLSPAPGHTVPHGTRLRMYDGRDYEVVWPLWRRVLVALGFGRATPMGDGSTYMTFSVREVRGR